MLPDPASGRSAWPAAMIVWGPGFYGSAHRHHCVQLLVTLRGSLRVRSGMKTWRKCGAVLVRPDAIHEVDARGSTLLIGFISTESVLGVALSERIEGEIAYVTGQQLARWRAILGRRPTGETVGRWLIGFIPHERRALTIHPGIRRVLIHLRETRTELDNLSLKALADIAGLSPSRFMHLFTRSVGVPLRPYVLWLRLQRAASDVIRGASVTSAAHRAGFADGAHLTRTCRRMLGLRPSDLALQQRLSRISLDEFIWRVEPSTSGRSDVDRMRHPSTLWQSGSSRGETDAEVTRSRVHDFVRRVRSRSGSGPRQSAR
jgi:AraC-like DNA-binding protein